MIAWLRIAWARARQSWRVALAVLVVVAIGAVLLVIRAKRRRAGEAALEATDARLEAALEKASHRIAEANAKASIEVAVARSRDEAVHAELRQVAADPDAARRRRALIELRKRVTAAQDGGSWPAAGPGGGKS